MTRQEKVNMLFGYNAALDTTRTEQVELLRNEADALEASRAQIGVAIEEHKATIVKLEQFTTDVHNIYMLKVKDIMAVTDTKIQGLQTHFDTVVSQIQPEDEPEKVVEEVAEPTA